MKEVSKPKKKSIDVRCSKCGAFFEVTEDLLHEVDVPVDDELVEVTLFLCPRCYDVNIMKVDSDSLREMRKAIDRNARVFKIYCDNKQVDAAKRSLDKLNEKKKALSEHTDRLVNLMYDKLKVKDIKVKDINVQIDVSPKVTVPRTLPGRSLLYPTESQGL